MHNIKCAFSSGSTQVHALRMPITIVSQLFMEASCCTFSFKKKKVRGHNDQLRFGMWLMGVAMALEAALCRSVAVLS